MIRKDFSNRMDESLSAVWIWIDALRHELGRHADSWRITQCLLVIYHAEIGLYKGKKTLQVHCILNLTHLIHLLCSGSFV